LGGPVGDFIEVAVIGGHFGAFFASVALALVISLTEGGEKGLPFAFEAVWPGVGVVDVGRHAYRNLCSEEHLVDFDRRVKNFSRNFLWIVFLRKNPRNIDLDVGMEAVVDGAAVDRGFEEGDRGVIGGEGQLDFHGQGNDAAGSIGAHVFFYADFHSCEIDLLALRDNAHDRGHAAAERSGNEVGGRKGFATTVVVDRCIGD
jgi:hypothetical protein